MRDLKNNIGKKKQRRKMTKQCNKCIDGWIKEEGGICWCECKARKVIVEQIGEKFKDCDIANTKLLAHQDKAKVILSKPEGSYFLVGDFGRGKTHLLASQYGYLLKKYRRPAVRFWREVDLVEDWQNWEEGRYYVVSELKDKDYKHIFLDDLGRAKITERVQQEMYGLIDWIYTSQIGLSISSNFSYEKLIDKYGGATVRRIKDICKGIKI